MTRGYQPGPESAQGPTSKRAESPRPGSVREQRALPFYFTDLHVHHRLPHLGGLWGRYMQGFRLDPGGPEFSQADKASPTGYNPGPSIFGVAWYETFLISPRAARKRLLSGLERLARCFGGSESGKSMAPKNPGVEAATGLDDAKNLTINPDEKVPATAGRILRKVGDLQSTSQSAGSDTNKFFLAVESLRFLETPGDLSRLWDLGVRSLQPIHFLDTDWGGSSREGFLPDSGRGLSALGREMLGEMNRLGFILDLAHMNRKTAEDCLALYRGPVMCSHTGLAEVKAVRRNLDSDLAGEIFRRRGVVGVTCWRHLLGSVSLGEVRSVTGRLPAEIRAGGLAAPSRLAWTVAFCKTVAAMEKCDANARIAIGSDRGAPIQAPPWFFSPANLEIMRAVLSESSGWNRDRFQAFLGGHACEFLSDSLPA